MLVTGAARAIGRATVEVLADRGHEVVATARDVATLAGLPAALVLPLDVSDPESVRAAVAEAGELDAVVNNAGLTGHGPLESYPARRRSPGSSTSTRSARCGWRRPSCRPGASGAAGCW